MVAVKFLRHEGLDLREGVEPFEEGGGFVAGLHFLVELLADFVRELGDFSDGFHRLFFSF